MDTLIVDNHLYYLPGSEGDVRSLIIMARQKNVKLRGRGAYHSVSCAVDPDNDTDLRFMLSKMNKVSICEKTNTVSVDSGCHLGHDPYDPTKISTNENGLFMILNRNGYALPDMGGITHQTVGGFLSTGASGSNVLSSFGESLVSVTFIPADSDDPRPITVSRTDPNPDLFYAVGVSMGLLGIIVSAVFSLVKRFVISGKEVITKFADCEVDMSGMGNGNKISLRKFLMKEEFKRLLWYPQPRVSKVVVWRANACPGLDKPIKVKKYQITPYRSFPGIMRFLPVQNLAFFIYRLFGNLPERLRDSLRFRRFFYKHILPRVLGVFVSLDRRRRDGTLRSQKFEDYWYSSLPMDNGIDDKLIPVKFTELWIPFEPGSEDDAVAAVLRKLNEVYRNMYAGGDGPIPGGDFCVEMVAGKESDFWMSPSYKTKVFRVDVFWFGDNAGSPADDFYPVFWRELAQFKYRCHWGKYLPPGEGDQGWRYLKPLYPKWDDFMALRRQYDPKDIFLTDYWRSHLGIYP
jgi:D-arabinono-1,4-lactone oxidase